MNNDLISRLKAEILKKQYTITFCLDHGIERSISLELLWYILDNALKTEEQPQGDLISREALKKVLQNREECKECTDIDCINCFYNIVDNAPTENAISIEESYERYSKGYLQGYERGKAAAIPKGEWVEPFESNGKTYHKCNHCHISSELILFGNFCPNCGADMREEGGK